MIKPLPPAPYRIAHSRRGAATWLALATLAAAFCATPAFARKKHKAPPGPPADIPGHVLYLARQLPGMALDESQPLTSQIQKLVLDDLQSWLAAGGAAQGDASVPLDVRVRRHLENDFSKLHAPLAGDPLVFVQPWQGQNLIGAGYTLSWSDYNRINVIALFPAVQGKPQLAALTDFVPHCNLNYAFFAPSSAGDFRFMVYGFRLGKSQLRLTAAVYAFNGKTVQQIWETKDAYDGKIEFSGEKFTIRFLKEDEYIQAVESNTKPPRYEAVYQVTPAGVSLLTQKVIPY